MTWVVEDGVYMSPILGLRIAPPPGWDLLLRSDLAEDGVDADVGLNSDGAQIVFSSEPAPSSERLVFIAALHAEAAAQFDGIALAPIELDVAAKSMNFTRTCSGDLEQKHGVRFNGATAVRVYCWSVPPTKAGAKDPALRGLAGVSLLGAAERQTLRAKLERSLSPMDSVTDRASVRRRVFRDFTHRVSWVAPNGLWRLNATPAPSNPNVHEDTILTATECGLGLELELIVSDRPQVTREEWRSELGNIWEETVREPSAPGWLSSEQWGFAISRFQRRGLEHARTSFYSVVGDRAIALSVSGFATRMTAAASSVHAVLTGLNVHDRLPQNTPAPNFTDSKYGIAIDVPDGFRRAPTLETPVESGLARVWLDDAGQKISVMAVPMPFVDPTWTDDSINRIVMSRLDELNATLVETTSAQLGGRPAQRFSAQRGSSRLHTFALEERGVLYALFFLNTSNDLASTTAASFRFTA